MEAKEFHKGTGFFDKQLHELNEQLHIATSVIRIKDEKIEQLQTELKEARERIAELKDFLKANEIVLRQYKNFHKETLGRKLYMLSKKLLTK